MSAPKAASIGSISATRPRGIEYPRRIPSRMLAMASAVQRTYCSLRACHLSYSLGARGRGGLGEARRAGKLQGHRAERVDRHELGGVSEALDRQFALAHEDVVGQLRLARQPLSRQRACRLQVALFSASESARNWAEMSGPGARIEAHVRTLGQVLRVEPQEIVPIVLYQAREPHRRARRSELAVCADGGAGAAPQPDSASAASASLNAKNES